MKKISVLGPKDTFSDYAAQKYLENHPQSEAEISYQKTIRNVFEDLKSGNSQIAVVPIENMSQGIVAVTHDALNEFDVCITEELILPVQFSFLSKIKHSQIKKIFVHPVAQGQCSKFLCKYPSSEIIHTDSNMASFEKLNEFSDCGAIVPSHIFEANEKDYRFCIQNISDNQNNYTRFLVLQNSNEAS